MISQKMAETINRQINNEMYSAYLYMAMSAHCSTIGLNGFAKWFMIQYHEEMFHAMKFYNYLLDQGAEPRLEAIKEPPAKWASVKEMFENTLAHEKTVTKNINDIADLAQKENDHATYAFNQWYVNEQVEEEKNDNDILARLAIVGEKGPGLYMLDGQLGSRSLGVQSDFSGGIGEGEG